jgi:hypothetical protein
MFCERLGGAVGIRRIVDGTFAARMSNSLIGHRLQHEAIRPECAEVGATQSSLKPEINHV